MFDSFSDSPTADEVNLSRLLDALDGDLLLTDAATANEQILQLAAAVQNEAVNADFRQRLAAQLPPALLHPAREVRQQAVHALHAAYGNALIREHALAQALVDLDSLPGNSLAPLRNDLQIRSRIRAEAADWLRPLLPSGEQPTANQRADNQPPAGQSIAEPPTEEPPTEEPTEKPQTGEPSPSLAPPSYQSPITDPQSPRHTLDLHLTPTHVQLRFSEQGHDERYFEAALQLDHTRRYTPGRQRGEMLYRALFHGETERGYRLALSRLGPGESLRIRLRIAADATHLHREPWEFLWDSARGAPIAANAATPFARILPVGGDGATAAPLLGATQPLRILGVLASPSQTESDPVLAAIDADELAALHGAIERVRERNVAIAPLTSNNLLSSRERPVTLDAILERLGDAAAIGQPLHVLHLLCHGDIDPEHKRGFLVLQHQNGTPCRVSEEDFAEALRPYVADGLRLVVLASCCTGEAGAGEVSAGEMSADETGALRGVARRLVAGGVPAVIAMQQRLEIEAARLFSQRFYDALLHTGEIDRATNRARHRLYEKRLRPDDAPDTPGRSPGRIGPRQWGVPVLFSRVPDGRLFQIDSK